MGERTGFEYLQVDREGDVVTMQEIFRFDRQGIDAEGKVVGELAPTGLRPACSEKLRLSGFELPWQLFERQSAVGAR